jgi:hypothetical protein
MTNGKWAMAVMMMAWKILETALVDDIIFLRFGNEILYRITR